MRVILDTHPMIESISIVMYIKCRGVSHSGLAIYIKNDLQAKEEELWKLKYFTIAKIHLIFKTSSKRNQNPSRCF
jgi:hypothetical protein